MRHIPPVPAALWICSLLLLLVRPSSAAPSFAAAVRYDCPGIPSLTTLAVGDIDEDGRPDIVGAQGAVFDHPVFAFRGTGAGGFGAMEGLQLYTPMPYAVALGRFRGAGSHLDLVLTNNESRQLWVVPGNGDATFTTGSAVNLATGLDPRFVATGYFNGDDGLDVAVVNRNSNTVGYWTGNGDLTFGAPTWFGTGISPGPLTHADMDVDGLPDFALTSMTPGAAHVVTLQPIAREYYPRFDYPAPGAVTGAVGDFSGDGVPDMAVTGVGEVRVLQNNGYGILALLPDVYAASGSSLAMAAADLDGNGTTDLVRANMGDSTVSIWSGDGDGTLGTKTDLAVGAAPWALALADLDGDGDLDVVVGCNAAPYHVAVLLNTHVAAGVAPAGAPSRLALLPARPNPARAGVTVAFDLPAPSAVTVRIVDVQGRTVRTLASAAPFAAGRATLAWDGLAANGRPADAGLYFVHLRAADGTEDAGRFQLLR